MINSERTGGKYINIKIQRSTHQQLINLAGPDLQPEIYLENIVNQITAGIPLDNLKQTSTIIQTPLFEIKGKMAVMADSLQRLMEITLENRRAIESIRATLTPLPLNRFESFGTGTGRQDNRLDTHVQGMEKPYFSSQFQDNQVNPVTLPEEAYDEGGAGDPSHLEAKIKKYEEENPW